MPASLSKQTNNPMHPTLCPCLAFNIWIFFNEFHSVHLHIWWTEWEMWTHLMLGVSVCLRILELCTCSDAKMESKQGPQEVWEILWRSLNTSEWTLVHLSWEVGRIPWQRFFRQGKRESGKNNLMDPSSCSQVDCENQGKFQARNLFCSYGSF